jgi:hypothetical protein
MDACGLSAAQAPRSQAHLVWPAPLAEWRGRLDEVLRAERIAFQAAAAMAAGLLSPAHLVGDTFPAAQGPPRVTDATTLYQAPKKSSASWHRSPGSASSTRPP